MDLINKKAYIKLCLSSQKINEDKFVIGNINSNTYLEVPKEALLIINLCDGKKSIDEIQKEIKKDNNMDIDVIDFIQFLKAENLIYSVNSNIIGKDNNIEYPQFIKKVSDFLFSKNSCFLYLFIIIFDFIMIFKMKNFPKYDNAYIFADNMGISLLLFFFISWIITFIHEAGHFFSAIKLNIPVSFKLNLRMLFLVVESDINGIWSIEKNKRYICYLAGICWEGVILLIALILKNVLTSSLLINVCSTIILVIILNFIWQFMIFLRTDLYLVIFNYFELSEWHNISIDFIKQKMFHKQNNVEMIYSNMPIIIYLIIYLFGIIFSIIYSAYSLLIYVNAIVIAIKKFDINNMLIILDSSLTFFIVFISIIWTCVNNVDTKSLTSALGH